MKHKKPERLPNRRGVTLTELLVVLVIVSLLSAIIIPTASNRSLQAKIAVAKNETREIAQAEETCALTHGFYVPIHLLDNLNNDVANTLNLTNDILDDLENEIETQTYIIDPFTSLNAQVGLNQLTLEDANTIPRVADLITNWSGPFVNFKNVYQDPNVIGGGAVQVRRDYPLDPWGQPYRFYSPLGIIGTGADNLIPDNWSNDSTFDGNIQRGLIIYELDRFAIVSYGPDMEPNTLQESQNRTGDDIVYVFGSLFTPASFREFY